MVLSSYRGNGTRSGAIVLPRCYRPTKVLSFYQGDILVVMLSFYNVNGTCGHAIVLQR